METRLQSSRDADATKSSATSPPAQITTAPSQERFELLLKRQNGPTCGYISGDTASPMTCRPGFSCTVGSTWGEFGCCNQVECDAGYHEACVDPVNNRCLVGGIDFGAGCDIYSKILSCPTACVTHVLKSSQFPLPASTYLSWSCGPKISTRIALLTATNAAGNVEDGSNGGSGNNGLSLNPVIPGITGSGGTGSTGNSNAGNSGGGSSSSGISSAAIGGIVAGGAVVLLIIGLGTCWIRRSCNRRRKPPTNDSQTMVSGWLDNQRQAGRY
ncbi:hypothetical protein B0T18DRAFT_195416 [Schizothecium vesticola]|uniref:Uncharacterized protein n=1 Tax=Schizothecium vesticola TaxID=314040 RepID=A0AA40K340_9PEZI|nr:hypothetical protein B0T18DRAFT_195416 [Schizothecium vesticola]